MKNRFTKKTLRTLSTAFLMTVLSVNTAFAGQWKQEGVTWSYLGDNGANATGWTWIDGKCYYFDTAGNMLSNITTPDGFTLNTNGEWVVDGVIQTQTNDSVMSNSEEYPLKGSVEHYFTTDPDEGLIWAWNRIYLMTSGKDLLGGLSVSEYTVKKAIEDKNIAYLYSPGQGVVASLAKLAGVPISAEYEANQQTQALTNEIKAFLNSFDWKNATDLEKAVNICNWIQKADYDYDNLSNVDASSHGLYGCLVEKRALCDGYVDAARLLGLCVGLPVDQIGSVNHAYPVFYVDGVWLANEPTTKDKYFKIADAYAKTFLGEYQLLGKYCEGTGYVVPKDISHIPGVGTAWIHGEEAQVIYFK